MDLPELTVDVDLDEIDSSLNWLQPNQPNSQIEQELEELFNYFDNSNKEVESQLRKIALDELRQIKTNFMASLSGGCASLLFKAM